MFPYVKTHFANGRTLHLSDRLPRNVFDLRFISSRTEKKEDDDKPFLFRGFETAPGLLGPMELCHKYGVSDVTC